MISMLIQQQISQLKWGFGAALALVLLIMALGIYGIFTRAPRRGACLRVGAGMSDAHHHARRWFARARRTGKVITATVLLWVWSPSSCYLIFPVFVVVPVSFSSAKYLQFPPPGWSLQWYQNYFDRPGLGASDLREHPGRRA